MSSAVYPEFVLPNLEFLRKRAKEWKKLLLAGDSRLTVLYRGLHPSPESPISLQRVQHMVAVEEGFKSWAEVLRHLRPVEYPPALRAFLGDDGRLAAWPVKRSRQLLFLEQVAQRIKPGVVYSERQFNTVLHCYHSFNDPAMIRRDLLFCGRIKRKIDGTSYWRPTEK